MPQARNGRRRNGSAGRLSGSDVIAQVRRDLPQLLGRPIESVLGLERDDDGGWNVMVQVVELSRIPHSTDVLGAYAVQVDGDGELVGWRRRRRYHRNQADED
jgi:Gas vesicle synthesis protein GvpO